MVYVITGGPGFGKSVLIDKLHKLGYPTGGEIARQIIEDQVAIGGDLLPWKDVVGFEKNVMTQRIAFLKSIETDQIAFSDRGLPDQAAFSYFKGKKVSDLLHSAIISNRYAQKVIITPPWKQIYRMDQIRSETYEEAERIHHFIVKAYLDLNYELIDLPFTNPDQRVEFIIKNIGNKG